jgi:predicted transcriptional regulator
MLLKRYHFHMVTTVNLPSELHAALKRIADDEHRSMNATILVAVEQYVASRSHRSKVREVAADVASRDAELLDRLSK